jgi:predicted O-methyltransferase YrrM
MTQEPSFVDEHLLQIGPIAFHCEHPIRTVPEGRLPVAKTRALVEAYIEMNRTLRPQRIVELGVYKGGSTVLLSELSKPQKLVALELSTEPVPVLTDYLNEDQRRHTVRPYLGVNQADKARIAEIVEAEFGGDPLDLVIDDASHLYDESLASFESLFPLLRPGGLYLIEDWTWQHLVADGVAKVAATTRPEDLPMHMQREILKRMHEVAEGRADTVVPLSRLALELVLACASSGDVVADVSIGPFWTQVRRGPAALEVGGFRVADTFHDHFNLLGST